MCMEDVRLGRKTATQQINITVAATTTPVIDRDPRRITLTFFPPASGRYTLQVSDNAVLDAGVTIASGGHPVDLNIKDHGDCVTKAWSAIHSVGGVTLSALQGTLDLT